MIPNTFQTWEIPIMKTTSNPRWPPSCPWLVACWSAAQTVSAMRGSDVPAVDKAPGDPALLGSKLRRSRTHPRTFQQQPPLVPHPAEGFDDITSEDNGSA